jgi:hypothetical protein
LQGQRFELIEGWGEGLDEVKRPLLCIADFSGTSAKLTVLDEVDDLGKVSLEMRGEFDNGKKNVVSPQLVSRLLVRRRQFFSISSGDLDTRQQKRCLRRPLHIPLPTGQAVLPQSHVFCLFSVFNLFFRGAVFLYDCASSKVSPLTKMDAKKAIVALSWVPKLDQLLLFRRDAGGTHCAALEVIKVRPLFPFTVSLNFGISDGSVS